MGRSLKPRGWLAGLSPRREPYPCPLGTHDSSPVYPADRARDFTSPPTAVLWLSHHVGRVSCRSHHLWGPSREHPRPCDGRVRSALDRLLTTIEALYGRKRFCGPRARAARFILRNRTHAGHGPLLRRHGWRAAVFERPALPHPSSSRWTALLRCRPEGWTAGATDQLWRASAC